MTRSVWLGALVSAALWFGVGVAPALCAETTIDWQCSVVTASGATQVGNCPVSALYPLPTSSGGYDKVIPDATAVTATTYTLNYALGSWRNVAVFRTIGQPSGLLDAIQLNSKGGMTTGANVWAFRRSSANLSSTCTDNVLFALSSADLPYLVPGFPVTITPATVNATTQSTATYAFTPPISVNNVDPTPSLNLAFCVVTNGTPTIGSVSDLIFNYGMVQD